MKASIRHGESASSMRDDARQLDQAADALLRHAGDCDRWGFVNEAVDARSRARRLRVHALLHRASAAGMDGAGARGREG
jgi:hypothetical protein